MTGRTILEKNDWGNFFHKNRNDGAKAFLQENMYDFNKIYIKYTSRC